MSPLEIFDKKNGLLSFDLRDVLAVIEPFASGLIWYVIEFEPYLDSRDPLMVLHERFVKVKGMVQNQDGIVHLKAQQIMPLRVTAAEMQSHDFH